MVDEGTSCRGCGSLKHRWPLCPRRNEVPVAVAAATEGWVQNSKVQRATIDRLLKSHLPMLTALETIAAGRSADPAEEARQALVTAKTFASGAVAASAGDTQVSDEPQGGAT